MAVSQNDSAQVGAAIHTRRWVDATADVALVQAWVLVQELLADQLDFWRKPTGYALLGAHRHALCNHHPCRPVASRRPSEPPRSMGLPVTTPVAVEPVFME